MREVVRAAAGTAGADPHRRQHRLAGKGAAGATMAAATAAALVESALRHVALLEEADYREIKISVKASDASRTVEAYRLLAQRTRLSPAPGRDRSRHAPGRHRAVQRGAGDTAGRGHRRHDPRVPDGHSRRRKCGSGSNSCAALGLRDRGPGAISCPTCGRIQIDVVTLAQRVEAELESTTATIPTAPRPLVAVMGCMVNGPGEARRSRHRDRRRHRQSGALRERQSRGNG